MIAGEANPLKLAALAHRRIRAPLEILCEALLGRVTDHHRFLLRLHLDQYDALDAAIERIDRQVHAALARMDEKEEAGQAPMTALVALLMTIPGVGLLAARMILAEIGRDMRRFPSAGHLASWAGLCPGNNESAGKRRSSRLRKGAPWLKTLLVQCAWAASRKKDSYFRAQFQRLRSRRGPKKAACASALVATVGDASRFKNGRELAAWLGLVPSQNSTGGKTCLGHITKAGDRYVRQLLVVGATGMLRWAKAKPAASPWRPELLTRKKPKVAAVALANKMARMAWAILVKGGTYQAPTPAAVTQAD